MRVRPRSMVLLSGLLALAAPATALLLHSGAPAVTAQPASVRAEVAHSPERVLLPAAAAPVVRRVAVRPAAPRVARPTRVVARTAPKVAVVRVAPVAAPVAKAPRPVTTTAPRAADDYPYRTAAGSSQDRWGFTQRQCVSFAAWRLAQKGRPLDNATQHWGSALNWDDTARSRGVAVTTAPRVGAIAQWNAGESSTVAGGGRFTAGGYGHVGYVAAVYADGTALVEQYNLGGDRSYSALRMTAPRYLLV